LATTTLRKVGGSVMLAVPPALLDLLNLRPGSTVGVAVDDGKLVIAPIDKPRYRLADLIAQCDASPAPDEEERAWLDEAPTGSELL
jgi:antitoxin ChpS